MFDDDDFDLPDDLAAMADAAGAALAGMGDEFAADALGDAKKMRDHIKAASNADAAQFDTEIAEAFSIAHNLKGQGQTFGYDLVSTIGDKLCHLSRPINQPSPKDLVIMSACAEAIVQILTSKITGDGGEVGAQLRADLGIS